jgi:hypothetical protein
MKYALKISVFLPLAATFSTLSQKTTDLRHFLQNKQHIS